MEIYISTDVETDGPIPGPNSMLSLGAAAFKNYELIGTFSVNLSPLPGASPDPNTEAWWKQQPKEIYNACRTDQKPPEEAMKQYVDWVLSFINRRDGTKPVFVGYPATFDFLFVYWYLIKFVGSSPFSFSALDIKSYAMAMLGSEYGKSTKKNMPKRWFNNLPPHTHKAVDDAIEQGYLFMNILKDNKMAQRVQGTG
jgi:DNA polymerase III alpha subunit (gram-positive type)